MEEPEELQGSHRIGEEGDNRYHCGMGPSRYGDVSYFKPFV